ncbi:MAG: beta-galactosidase GalB [Mangrovibacterium sp.]
MRKTKHFLIFFSILAGLNACSDQKPRVRENFNDNWHFSLADDFLAYQTGFNDLDWRALDVPHDWGIEGSFSRDNTATPSGGALPTGIGWYRKSFKLSESLKEKAVFIDFDGIYRNSEVWINGHYLGKRPNGYISFRYDLTPFLKFGKEKNVIAVRVDNSAQPNSRWYTGSGIYRNVWLVTTGAVHVSHWGTYLTTPQVSREEATSSLAVTLDGVENSKENIRVLTRILDAENQEIDRQETFLSAGQQTINQKFNIKNPVLWSVDNPYLYRAVTQVFCDGWLTDEYGTPLGIRSFEFDAQKGFFLNGQHLKIKGVCMHHDLGALGAAINTRALERQLEILKEMGCNAIRASHNPPAPELLELCDRMGFMVMDEAFDMWKKKKVDQDYHTDWEDWHKKDLRDQILRDRNHPSVFIWSIGNEIREQFDSTGISIARELTDLVKSMDTTRPVTSALTENDPGKNFIYRSGALDVLGFNYKHESYPELPVRFPGGKIIATETASAFATRGVYVMPSDSVRHWPVAYKAPLVGANPDCTASAYDNTVAYWGATHEASWNAVKNCEFISGLFIWSGFDYLGEPDPYPWPARSSYLGIIDLAGFPKDAYYMYQSEWTDKPVLHVFPHWNWEPGQVVDVWAYYSQAGEVELFLNGKSLGTRKKTGDELHVMWRILFEPGILRAVSRKDGKTVLTREIKTAGAPAKIALIPDRDTISADGRDLSFVTVKILDKDGTLVPYADNRVQFSLSGPGFIAGVDNGYQASPEPFKADYRKAFKGMCLAIIRSAGEAGTIIINAQSEGLESASLIIKAE